MIAVDFSQHGECYVSTCSGRRLYPLAPDAAQIDIEDIAHGLANQPCFNGQTSDFYSLAQHSLLVASLVPLPLRRAALLHDAAAAYFGGMTQSVRRLLPELAIIEKRVMAAIGEKFAISGFDAPAIKRAHLVAQATEKRDVCPHMLGLAEPQDCSAPIPRRIKLISREEAREQFMEQFIELEHKDNRLKAPVVTARGCESIALVAVSSCGRQHTPPPGQPEISKGR
jgi:uncharacterized protein